MNRAAIISVGLCLGLSALPAHAQGVPTQDNSAIGRAIARVTALAEDLGVQQDKDRTESTLADVQADQLRVLEEMTAAITGPGFDENGIVDAVETVTHVYESARQDGERFLDTYRRIGMNPFKEALYG